NGVALPYRLWRANSNASGQFYLEKIDDLVDNGRIVLAELFINYAERLTLNSDKKFAPDPLFFDRVVEAMRDQCAIKARLLNFRSSRLNLPKSSLESACL